MGEDLLRERNYGLSIDEEIERVGFVCAAMRLKGEHSYEYGQCTTFVESRNNKKLKYVRGDIVRLDDAGRLPKYARKQFAVVIDRFKVTKKKPIGTFNDYGAVILIISGPKKGKVTILWNGFTNCMNLI